MRQAVTRGTLPTWSLMTGIAILALSVPLRGHAQEAPGVLVLPEGFQIEKVVNGLTYPTSITWDDQGQMFVAEAGGQFLEEPAPSRIMRVEDGRATEFVRQSAVSGSSRGVSVQDKINDSRRDRA